MWMNVEIGAPLQNFILPLWHFLKNEKESPNL